MTVAEMRYRMSHAEFLNWVGFYNHEASEATRIAKQRQNVQAAKARRRR